MQKATLNSVELEEGHDFHTAKIDLASHMEAIVVYGREGEELDSRVNTILEAFNEEDIKDDNHWYEVAQNQEATIEKLKAIIVNSDIRVEDILDSL